MNAPIDDLTTLFLKPSGWLESAITGRPMGASHDGLPWLTYSAIEFLAQTLRPTDKVFEFGLGFGSSWISRRCRQLVSVEHDPQWISLAAREPDDNHEVLFRPIDAAHEPNSDPTASKYFELHPNENWPELEPHIVLRRGLEDRRFIAYASSISAYDSFDIVIIDGMARRLATFFAISHLKDEGLLVFDNSNRDDYQEAYELLGRLGYRYIPFWGLVPGATFYTCTSIFFKSLNRFPHGTANESLLALPRY